MKERIRKIRKDADLTQDEFAIKVNLTKNYISLVENGSRNLADRTISDICRIFNVNEEWLRNGTGDPYHKRTRDQEVAEFLNDIMEESDNNYKKRLILAMSKLSEKE